MVPSHPAAVSLQSELFHRQDSFDETRRYSQSRTSSRRESYSSTISIIQTQQYRQEMSKSQIASSIEHDSAFLRQQYPRGALRGSAVAISPEDRPSYSGARPSSSTQGTAKDPHFYERGPTFRHSWTEGEETAHLHGYPREQSPLVASKGPRGPPRKTGVAGPRAIPTQRVVSMDQYRESSVGLSGAYYRQQEARGKSLDVESGRIHPSDATSGEEASSSEEMPAAIIISGSGLPEGTKRFVVDKFTVTFTEKDEEDTLI